MLCLLLTVATGSIDASEPSVPSSLGVLRYGTAKKFDEPGLGAALTYRGEGSTLTLYIYDATIRDIPRGIHSNITEQQFAQAVSAISGSDEWDASELLCRGASSLPGANPPLEVYEAHFRNKTHDYEVESFLFLTAIRNRFVKVRWTIHALSPDLHPSVRAAVLSDVSRLVGAWSGQP
jgi:hypothetical protein